jgi:hypothetical protein
VTESVFHERLAFARLLRHLGTGRCPSNAEIGRAVGATGQWVVPYTRSDEAPAGYGYIRGLVAFFSLGKYEDWFVTGAGEPPMPKLWGTFVANYRRSMEAERAEEAAARPKSFHGEPPASDRKGERRRRSAG